MENRQVVFASGRGRGQARTPMEIFESLPEGTRVQLIENNLVAAEPSPTYEHQDALRRIFLSLANFVDSRNIGKVLFAPFDVYLDGKNAFQPDILFVAADRLHLIGRNGLDGAPDLVVEALSSFTGKYDREEKKYVYERSGVKEYWIIHPETSWVQGYRLVKGTFEPVPPAVGVIESDLLGESFRF